MTMVAHTGTVAADAIAAKKGSRMALVYLVLIVTAATGFVYSQVGQIHFAPTVTKNLTRQSALHSDAGDPMTALAASRKATEVYRRLMRIDVVRYAPSLATSLHNLSARLREAGDDAGALAAIDEAIQIRQKLAKSAPERYLTDLKQSMELLAQIEAARNEGSTTITATNLGR